MIRLFLLILLLLPGSLAASEVRFEMEGVEKLDVPLVVEGGWGANWHDAKA